MNDESHSHDDEWEAALNGDHKAFRRLVDPHLDELIEAARRDITYYRALGELPPEELTPEELVGETFLRAWRDRFRRPRRVSLRGWLLGAQLRVLRQLLTRLRLENTLLTASVEDTDPAAPSYHDEESFWEWNQPDDVLLWEDEIATMPEEVEAALELEEETYRLPPRERRVLLLHDRHRLPLSEVAWAAGLPIHETATILQQARADVRRQKTQR